MLAQTRPKPIQAHLEFTSFDTLLGIGPTNANGMGFTLLTRILTDESCGQESVIRVRHFVPHANGFFVCLH